MFGRTVFGVALLLLATDVLPQSHELPATPPAIDVLIHSPVQLTPIERRKLRTQIRKFGRGSTGEFVRELYQDKGYFKVEVIPISNSDQRLMFQVLPGKQYHLVGITWTRDTAIVESELKNLIPFTPGELFNRTKIVEGLNTVRNLYGSRGYINYTCVPTPQTNDDVATIAFEMDVDEGGQFRFGELDVEGMEEAHRGMLLSAWQGLRDRPYSRGDADRFFNRFFKSPRPNITPEDYAIRQIDEANHLVNYSLKFVPNFRYRITRSSQLEPVEVP